MSTMETTTLGDTDGLASWLGQSYDTPQAQAQADQALAAASGVVRDLTRQWLSYVADDVLVMDWNGGQSLFLPELPVADVTAVEARDAIDADTWTAWPPEQLQWSMQTGELVLSCVPWQGWPTGGWPSWLAGFPGRSLRGIRVTYSHGYNPLPPELIGVAYSMAGRMLEQPDGQAVSGETIGAYAYTVSSAALAPAGGGWAAGLTGPEAAIISRYRIGNRA